jgi:3-deoxy-D-manno-octulosonic-acid transferase
MYNLVLFLLGLCALPKILLQWSKYRHHARDRLGFNLPKPPAKGPVIWIHAVSFGETRAVLPLYKQLRKSYPDHSIVISSTTETGHNEAKKILPDADAHFLLPLDFSWNMRRLCKRLKPKLLILVESDFWYQLLKAVKEQRGKIALVNGKISEKSAKRFKLFRFFAKRLFGLIDCFCVQNEHYATAFKEIGVDPAKITVTGNIKLDAAFPKLSPQEKAEWKQNLGITATDRVLVIGSTHEPEEEWLFGALDRVWEQIPELKVIIVPRHPERFAHVAKHLRQRGLSVIAYSERAQKTGLERVVLIDAMGLLNTCYQLAEVAIVGGSFASHVGGHNIFEPAAVGVPVLFGPHMHDQPDLVRLILSAHAGQQLTLPELPGALLDLLNNPEKRLETSQHGLNLSEQARGATQRTYEKINNL